MEAPSAEQVAKVKSSFPDRSYHLVEIQEDEKDASSEVFYFIMTGPSKDEYKKFNDEILTAKDTKDEKDRVEKMRDAVERNALAQIRWPDRSEVQAIFARKAALSVHFADELHKAAGSNAEVRSKKL